MNIPTKKEFHFVSILPHFIDTSGLDVLFFSLVLVGLVAWVEKRNTVMVQETRKCLIALFLMVAGF
jgi:hypothetical protein